MSDDVFKQKKKISPQDFGFDPAPEETNPLGRVQAVQSAMAKESGREPPVIGNQITQEESPFVISGNMPPAFRNVLQNRIEQVNSDSLESFDHQNDTLGSMLPKEGNVVPKKKPVARPTPDSQVKHAKSSPELDDVLNRIAAYSAYDEVELPSLSKFYKTIPPTIHVRPMTGEEENILATPRFVKKGKAMDMIFERCIREPIDIQEMLSIDRMYLLIFLRGISYTPEYDVEVKCPNCSTKFNTMINLDTLEVEMCADDYGPDKLVGVLPKTGLSYKYRLATGEDEQAVTRHREMRIENFGDKGEDDTLLYRSALLLEYIDNITDTRDLMHLLRKLPVVDVNYIRNEINEPPFGVDTDVGLSCPACTEEFEIALPLETSFFFPGKKEPETQA